MDGFSKAWWMVCSVNKIDFIFLILADCVALISCLHPVPLKNNTFLHMLTFWFLWSLFSVSPNKIVMKTQRLMFYFLTHKLNTCPIQIPA